MKNIVLLALPIGLLCALSIAGCAQPSASVTPGPNCVATSTIGMASTDFSVPCAKVKVGTTVHFIDDSQASTPHTICLGTNQTCASNAKGPSQLQNPGLAITPGQTKSVTFSTPGSYQITATLHPEMNLTIDVTQ